MRVIRSRTGGQTHKQKTYIYIYIHNIAISMYIYYMCMQNQLGCLSFIAGIASCLAKPKHRSLKV